ncbi:hypothetical protein I6N90_12735 [Paenibacillus sp. GSMTC-2017]|uniref:hypothetical protein n=1 Tax=Paenibacillus sp. GSMTC-2017 TaxID=2794350 RepID=UPI0018D95CCA|nr:hypothetical protein [Paenibacillus sp. GSMTC-2017]MBH5318664.1 hypothetical protein [Paenibacillus sp. GSMTC-2017]
MIDYELLYVRHKARLSCLFTLIVMLPLLLSASFAYQAGNNFELTAGTNKSVASSSTIQYSQSKHPSDTKALIPNSPDVLAVAISLLGIYLLTIPLSTILTPYFQMLRDKLLAPIKFTSTFVDSNSGPSHLAI